MALKTVRMHLNTDMHAHIATSSYSDVTHKESTAAARINSSFITQPRQSCCGNSISCEVYTLFSTIWQCQIKNDDLLRHGSLKDAFFFLSDNFQMASKSIGDDDWKNLFSEAVIAMCKTGLRYSEQVSVEGVLAITLDRSKVLVVNINEVLRGKNVVCHAPLSATPAATKPDTERTTSILSRVFHQNDAHGPAQLLVTGKCFFFKLL